HPAALVEALAARASGNLMKIARAQDRCLLPVILAEFAEENSADRHVDAHAQGVGAANDLEQALLRQLFDQNAILREQPGMVQPDAVLEPFPDFRTVRAGELEPFKEISNGVLLLARADVDAGEILRALRGLQLRKVNHI